MNTVPVKRYLLASFVVRLLIAVIILSCSALYIMNLKSKIWMYESVGSMTFVMERPFRDANGVVRGIVLVFEDIDAPQFEQIIVQGRSNGYTVIDGYTRVPKGFECKITGGNDTGVKTYSRLSCEGNTPLDIADNDSKQHAWTIFDAIRKQLPWD